MKTLFEKPKDMTYTQMCIWIDENFYKSDCDYNRAYTFLWCIAYMLACKSRYFTTKADYEEFASILAYSTYQRMIDTSKVQIKSVLNYMKSIMYFRKAAYEIQRHQEIVDTEFNKEWDPLVYNENYKSIIEKSNREKVILSITDLISELPRQIRKFIPRAYKSDKQIYHNIYISCLLSLINRYTLPNASSEYIKDKMDSSPTFNEANYYKKHLDDDIILWCLPDSFEAVIMVIINKVNKYVISEIREVISSSSISDTELSDITASAFATQEADN